MHKTSDFKMKDVVNVLDGKRLGAVTDIELDVETGRLTAIVVPQKRGGLCFWGRNEDIIIPWSQITKIGDCILVETPANTALPASKTTPEQKEIPPLAAKAELPQELPGSDNSDMS